MNLGVGAWPRVANYLLIVPVNHMDQVLVIALSKDVVSESPRPRSKKEEAQEEGE